MAKQRTTSKQIAWQKLQERITKRQGQGYTPINLPSYKELTEKEIRQLKYSKLDKYFEYVEEETGEVLSPKERRKQVRELGYEERPQESQGTYDTQDVFERIENMLQGISNVIEFKRSYRYTALETSEVQDELLGLLWNEIDSRDNVEYADYLLSVQEELASEISNLNNGYSETKANNDAVRIANLLVGGALTPDISTRLGDALDRGLL